MPCDCSPSAVARAESDLADSVDRLQAVWGPAVLGVRCGTPAKANLSLKAGEERCWVLRARKCKKQAGPVEGLRELSGGEAPAGEVCRGESPCVTCRVESF